MKEYLTLTIQDYVWGGSADGILNGYALQGFEVQGCWPQDYVDASGGLKLDTGPTPAYPPTSCLRERMSRRFFVLLAREANGATTRACPRCGATFVPTHGSQRYCTPRCSNLARYRRAAEAKK